MGDAGDGAFAGDAAHGAATTTAFEWVVGVGGFDACLGLGGLEQAVDGYRDGVVCGVGMIDSLGDGFVFAV